LNAWRSQLDYPGALADGLPIASGEIETAHRYVARQRLKRFGARWRVEYAEHMLALRIVRIDGDWENYWRHLARKAAANDNASPGTQKRIA
jgi:hypothetical protein